MENLPSCSPVSTTVQLHQLDLNETLREKARWELYKDAAACSLIQNSNCIAT